MALICITPPPVEPVSLPELKEMLRLDPDDNSQDSVLNSLNIAARASVEAITRRRIVQQTWELDTDFFPGYIDLKLTSQLFSHPFVSGSNAVLVGIRYAYVLPFPPIQSLNSFVYQNANGQVSSMIIGPLTIASVSNPLGGAIGITTATPHGLQSQSPITISGNSALLAVLGGQASQNITVTGDSSFLLNGTVGTGSNISGGGTVTGYNFIQDLKSQPARLTPIFGQMWPVARVVVNAVQIQFVCGYATPVTVSTADDSGALSGATFPQSSVGQLISIPGAGYEGGCLDTAIASVDGSGNATVRDLPMTAVNNATALWVNYGNPAHFHIMKTGIKFLVTSWFVNRLPSYDAKTRDCIRAIVSTAIDRRM